MDKKIVDILRELSHGCHWLGNYYESRKLAELVSTLCELEVGTTAELRSLLVFCKHLKEGQK